MFSRFLQRTYLFRTFSCDIYDLAAAFYKVATERYGESALVGIGGLFQSKTKVISPIKVADGKEIYGAFGEVRIRTKNFFSDFSIIGEFMRIDCNASAKYRQEAEAFLKAIEDYLAKNS